MEKKFFNYIMKINGIHNQLGDAKNSCCYEWKDANLFFVVCDEIKESVSVKILGEISYDFISIFENRIGDTITISEVFDRKDNDKGDNDSKYVTYVVIHDLGDLLDFIYEMRVYLAKNENDNSANIERDSVIGSLDDEWTRRKIVEFLSQWSRGSGMSARNMRSKKLRDEEYARQREKRTLLRASRRGKRRRRLF